MTTRAKKTTRTGRTRGVRKAPLPSPRDPAIIRDELAIVERNRVEAEKRAKELREELSTTGNPIEINGVSLVGPMLVAPRVGSSYFRPTFAEGIHIEEAGDDSWAEHVCWDGGDYDQAMLRNGMVFAKRADAAAAARAMASLLKPTV